jgi:anti-sigma regulatory factor (Ser/Thr protein kinase)
MSQPTGSRKSFHVSYAYLPEMVDFVSAFAHAYDLSAAFNLRLEIALEETLSNIIAYSGLTENQTIEIACSITESHKGIRIQVKDKGIAFNPLDEENLQARREKERGFGIQLIRSLMDEVEYNQQYEYNVLILTKYME